MSPYSSMNRWVLAILIWLGIDILLAAVAAPVIVMIVIPGLARAWSNHDFVYMFDVLLPNITLMIVPGGMPRSPMS